MKTRDAPSVVETSPVSLVTHLEELRKRLWVCILAVLIFSIGGFFLAPRVLEWLKIPAGNTLPALAFFSPLEAMLATLKVAFAVGIFLSMPILLYEVWVFVRPGLTPRERRFGLTFVVWGSLLFAGGAAFAYFGLLPVSLRFLLTFGGKMLTPVISISEYLSFTLTVILACGVVFELPLAVFFLTALGVISPRLLKDKWRVAFLGIVAAAAVITPTQDVFSLLLMALPLLVLYGVSIVVSQVALSGSKANNRMKDRKLQT